MNDIRLRPGQDEVCQYNGGFLGVPSVPGAGKTFTLTMLATRLIREERHLPGKILIVTYMNAAANNFKRRIGDFLERQGLPRNKGFEVMTLHALAMKIIKEKPEALYLTEEFLTIDEIEQIRVIQKGTSQWIQENPIVFQSFLNIQPKENSRQMKIKIDYWNDKINLVVKDMISYFKSNRIGLEDIPKLRMKISDHSLLHMSLSVYEKYENYLRHMEKIDFDDLIVKSIDLLKQDRELRERFQKTYTYIFEDEAQDSSILQEELLMLLSAKHKNLVRVGDINQSIMSTFTLSDPKLFKRFCDRKDTKVSRILVSSRSSKDIIALANYLVEWSKKFHPIEAARDSLEPQYIVPVDEDDPFPNPVPQRYTIGRLLTKTRREEFKRIANSIKRQLNKEKTVAVLVPNNYVMEEMKDLLEEEEVPYKEISSFPKERTMAAEAIGYILDYIAYPHDNHRLIKALGYIMGKELLENKDLIEFLLNCRLEEIMYPQKGEMNLSRIPKEIQERNDWKLVLENLEGIKQFLEGATSVEPEILVLWIAENLHFDDNQMAIVQKIAADIRYMLRLNPHWRIGELAEQLKQIKNTYNYFANIVYERQGFEAEPGIVNLITYHKSKGLEFDTVYLTCITAEEFPATFEDKFRSDYWFLKQDYKNPTAVCRAELDKIICKTYDIHPVERARIETIQERLRLLYVGITRAKENLLLSAHEAYETEYGSKKVMPSVYFQILKSYIERRRGDAEKILGKTVF